MSVIGEVKLYKKRTFAQKIQNAYYGHSADVQRASRLTTHHLTESASE